jgi:hypothetical protein
LIAVTIAGCSTSVDVPMDRIDEPAWREPGKYRLRLTDGGEYYVRRFSVVDSSVVVDERVELDRALLGDTGPPSNSIPIDQLRSVEKIESRKKPLLLVAGLVGATMALFIMAGTKTDE